MSILQYLKDTRAELRHVAWPTQSQTITYTALVIALSLFVAAYLGFFDFIFTTSLARIVEFLPERIPAAQDIATSTFSPDIIFSTSTPE